MLPNYIGIRGAKGSIRVALPSNIQQYNYYTFEPWMGCFYSNFRSDRNLDIVLTKKIFQLCARHRSLETDVTKTTSPSSIARSIRNREQEINPSASHYRNDTAETSQEEGDHWHSAGLER